MLEMNPIDALESLQVVYSHLARATDDIQSGRLEKADSVFENMLHELENYEVYLDNDRHLLQYCFYQQQSPVPLENQL